MQLTKVEPRMQLTKVEPRMQLTKVVASLLTGAVLLAGCGDPQPPGDAGRIDAKLVAALDPADARAVGQAVNAFGFDLFREVGDGKHNTVTSPLSVAVLLAMVLAGAQGDTAKEMAKVLHLEDSRDVRVGALLRRLADTDQVTLSVADGLWAGRTTPFENDYLTFVRNTFGASVEQADLGSKEAADAIDAWASKNTNGLIREIAADLGLPDANVVLVLLNAVYFLGEWKKKFDPAQTRPQAFTLPDGSKVDVPMMHMGGVKFGVSQGPGFKMLRLPYGKDGRVSMEVLLPTIDTTLPLMLKSLNANTWRDAVTRLQEVTVDELALPKFELRWKGELVQPLRKLGVAQAFSDGVADFRPMSPRNPSLKKVVHKTYIRTDEKGTEAAAVTGGAMVTSAKVVMEIFRVDRPFAFTISDNETGTVLFLGTVTDPRG